MKRIAWTLARMLGSGVVTKQGMARPTVGAVRMEGRQKRRSQGFVFISFDMTENYRWLYGGWSTLSNTHKSDEVRLCTSTS
jgi:hypothetical protein